MSTTLALEVRRAGASRKRGLDGRSGRVVVSRRPERAAERVAWPSMPPEYAEAIDAEGIRSALAVPIVVGHQVDGLLYVCSRAPRSFSDADETVLARLADHPAQM